MLLPGDSWVAVSGVIRPFTWVISYQDGILLISLFITTHEGST